jgi:hypothetical protein
MPSLLPLARKQFNRKNILVIVATFLLWAYCIVAIDPSIGLSCLGGMSFQLFAFVIGWLILMQKDPSGRLTFGNLGTLYTVVCIGYLLFPSVLWLTGSNIRIQYGAYVTSEIGNLLLWLHGLYFLAFATFYAIASLPIRNFEKLHRDQVPSGGRLVIAVFVIFISIVFTLQVLSTGELLPQIEREVAVFEAHDASVTAVQSGGLNLILYQILNRLRGFALAFMGMGFGLIYVKYAFRKMYSLLVLIPMLLIAGFVVIFTGGGRGSGIMAVVIGVVLVDFLSGPLRWRHLAVLLAIGLIGSEFLGYTRFLRTTDRLFSLPDWLLFWVGTEDKFFEQTAMFGKEGVALSVVNYTGETWGPAYFIQTVLKILPQQIVPFKMEFPSVANRLVTVLLGLETERGAGLAGTAIGEGYFIGGVPGVVVLGGITGLILGLIQRWLMGKNYTRVWHIIPLLYLAGNLLFIVRSDFYELLNTFILGVLPLWIVLRLLFGRLGHNSLWNRPFYVYLEGKMSIHQHPLKGN